jgi:acyl-CoA thioester hydrolase
MTQPLHVERMRLRWGEMDALRHLNNVAYFRYFEQARISWFDSLGIDYAPDGEGPILGSITCRFLKPALYPADLDIELVAGRVGNASFTLEHRMRAVDDRSVVYAEGEAVLVWIDLASGQSRPLPERVRATLQS